MSNTEHPDKGSIVKVEPCPACGTDKPYKVNVVGNVYLYCREPMGVHNGKYHECFMRVNYGTLASQELIHQAKKEGTFIHVSKIKSKKETTKPAGAEPEREIGIGHNGGPPIEEIDSERKTVPREDAGADERADGSAGEQSGGILGGFFSGGSIFD